MLNEIQGALMTEASRMQEQAEDLHRRANALAFVLAGTPEGVPFGTRMRAAEGITNELSEHAYNASTMHTLLDAKACVRESLSLRARMDSLEEEVLQGEHNLHVQETSLLQALFPAY